MGKVKLKDQRGLLRKTKRTKQEAHPPKKNRTQNPNHYLTLLVTRIISAFLPNPRVNSNPTWLTPPPVEWGGKGINSALSNHVANG